MLLFQEKVKVNQQPFVSAVEAITSKLNQAGASITPDMLMAAMDLETDGTFSPSIQNPNSTGTGLIQFLESTAKGLGTSTAALKLMSNVEQLYYVYKYLLPYAHKIHSFVDLYLTIFFPTAVGKPGSFVIETKDTPAFKFAKVNQSFDLDKNSKITVSEIQTALLNRIPKDYWTSFKKKVLSEEYSSLDLQPGLQLNTIKTKTNGKKIKSKRSTKKNKANRRAKRSKRK